VVHRMARAWNERWLGRRGRVLTVEVKKSGVTVAHNEACRPVILPQAYPPGQWIEVRYESSSDFHLYARE
jgi:tRNA A37 methylthiotransferase MiaB